MFNGEVGGRRVPALKIVYSSLESKYFDADNCGASGYKAETSLPMNLR
jgi:hypothetical protein